MREPISGAGGHRGILAAVAVVLAIAGAAVLVIGLPGGGPAGPSASAALAGTAPAAGSPAPDEAGTPQGGPQRDFGLTLRRARPVGLVIPAIGVRATNIVDLRWERDGTLQVPVDYGTPGWFEPGPSPGQFGPAVIAGHVDSRAGPGIFFDLGKLQRGDQVTVARADGTVAVFTTDAVERYAKDAFPTVKVYGNTTNRAELRLITCGGSFDRRSGHYRDNVVAFAHLTAVRRG